MNTIRFTPEEREAHDRAALIMSIPHTMVDYVNDDGKIDWDEFEKEDAETYHEYCELSIEELEQCLSEIYKSGGYSYGPVAEAIREQQEDVRNTQLRIPYY